MGGRITAHRTLILVPILPRSWKGRSAGSCRLQYLWQIGRRRLWKLALRRKKNGVSIALFDHVENDFRVFCTSINSLRCPKRHSVRRLMRDHAYHQAEHISEASQYSRFGGCSGKCASLLMYFVPSRRHSDFFVRIYVRSIKIPSYDSTKALERVPQAHLLTSICTRQS